MRRGYFLPILLSSRLATQGCFVLLLNWYPHFLDQSYTPIKAAGSRDATDRWWPISQERNVLETTKLIGMEGCPTSNNAHQFQCQRSKVKVIRSTNAEIGSVSYLPSSERKGLRILNLVYWWRMKTRIAADKCHDSQGQWSRSQSHVVRLEQKVPEIPKLVGKLLTGR